MMLMYASCALFIRHATAKRSRSSGPVESDNRFSYVKSSTVLQISTPQRVLERRTENWRSRPSSGVSCAAVDRSSPVFDCWLSSSSVLDACETRRPLSRRVHHVVVDSASVRRPSGSDACMTATWLILPVVICLSQRLSHACLSTNLYTVKLRMAH